MPWPRPRRLRPARRRRRPRPRPAGVGGSGEVPWNAFRLPGPLKAIWFQPGRILARWPRGGGEPPPRPRALFGAKSCDLKAVACLDRGAARPRVQGAGLVCGARAHAGRGGRLHGLRGHLLLHDGGRPALPDEPLRSLPAAPRRAGTWSRPAPRRASGWWPSTPASSRRRRRSRGAARPCPGGDHGARREAQRALPGADSFERSVASTSGRGSGPSWPRPASSATRATWSARPATASSCTTWAPAQGAMRLSLWDSCLSAGHARMAAGSPPPAAHRALPQPLPAQVRHLPRHLGHDRLLRLRSLHRGLHGAHRQAGLPPRARDPVDPERGGPEID